MRTMATSRDEHLSHPELGARLAEDIRTQLVPESNDIQIVVCDGLSAEAVHYSVPELLPVLLDGLHSRNLKIGQTILAPFGRVKLAEAIGDALAPKLVVMLIGERPGGDAMASRSMSAYIAYRLNDDETRADAARFSGNAAIAYEYSLISNIYAGGVLPAEAGSLVAEMIFEILGRRAAGNRLEALLQIPAA
jgi:ethanolamine ammonia-lyase large subunit